MAQPCSVGGPPQALHGSYIAPDPITGSNGVPGPSQISRTSDPRSCVWPERAPSEPPCVYAWLERAPSEAVRRQAIHGANTLRRSPPAPSQISQAPDPITGSDGVPVLCMARKGSVGGCPQAMDSGGCLVEYGNFMWVPSVKP